MADTLRHRRLENHSNWIFREIYSEIVANETSAVYWLHTATAYSECAAVFDHLKYLFVTCGYWVIAVEENEQKKPHKWWTSHERVSLILCESGFFVSCDCKKRRPEPQRMEQLNCGSWGFHMRWKCHTFSLIFQTEALEYRISEEQPRNNKKAFVFLSVRLLDNAHSSLAWLIGRAHNEVRERADGSATHIFWMPRHQIFMCNEDCT